MARAQARRRSVAPRPAPAPALRVAPARDGIPAPHVDAPSISPWEVGAGPLLLFARPATVPLAGLWCDWVVIVAAYWLFTAVAGRRRAWPAVTVAVMAFLLLTHVREPVQHALVVLGLRR